MKIIILVPDGVGVRNYIFSSFVVRLIEQKHEIYIYHKLSKSAIKEIKNCRPEIKKFIEIPDFIENPKARVIRESLAYARLLKNKKKLSNNTILNFWTVSKKGIKKKILYFISEFLGLFLSKSYSLMNKLDEIYEKEILKSCNKYLIKMTLKEISPDYIINLHQRSPLVSPIITLAKKINIKTSTVIFSWDNVPKGRLISRYDFYFVWSKLMKNELIKLYPEIKSSQIKITGTPQFEFYYDKKLCEEKKVFFSKYGLNENKKTICFSGNDLTSPYEANYLKDICEAINEIKEENRPQIIFRRCPVDKSDRFDKILKEYKKFVFSIDPDWRTEKKQEDTFTSIYPTVNDNYLLINTVKHSDFVINLGSTMAHDFAVFDKPCLYLNYNPINNSIFKVEDIFEFQHFRSMKNMHAVGWINTKEDIKNQIIYTLTNPNKVGVDRKKWLNKIVLHPLDKSSERLIESIINSI
ncbi:MAG: hypothetical protein V3V28_13490 [Polaribacter sp.]|uniref:hypothetical protein n=1 Tax=Polaribacter sp. TaxID=1920175 RepID=UPI002F351B00